MTDTNSLVLIGRLTRDAEIKALSSGSVVAKISLSLTRTVKRGDSYEGEANYFEAERWGRLAESLKPYLLKGQQVGISGSLKQERWEQDGQNRSKVVILIETLQLLGSNKNASPANAENGNGKTYQAGNTGAAMPQDSSQGGNDEFTDDIPF